MTVCTKKTLFMLGASTKQKLTSQGLPHYDPCEGDYGSQQVEVLHSLDALVPAAADSIGVGLGQKEAPVAATQLPTSSPQVNTLYGGIGPQKLLPACRT